MGDVDEERRQWIESARRRKAVLRKSYDDIASATGVGMVGQTVANALKGRNVLPENIEAINTALARLEAQRKAVASVGANPPEDLAERVAQLEQGMETLTRQVNRLTRGLGKGRAGRSSAS